jgi:hypothetical protein
VDGLKCAIRDGRRLAAQLRALPGVAAVELDFPGRRLTVSGFLLAQSVIDAVQQLGAGVFSAAVLNPAQPSIAEASASPSLPSAPPPPPVSAPPLPPAKRESAAKQPHNPGGRAAAAD